LLRDWQEPTSPFIMGNVVFGYLLPEIPPKYCMPERYFVIYEADLKIGKWQKEFEKLQLTESGMN
jgi:hypothetical protein